MDAARTATVHDLHGSDLANGGHHGRAPLGDLGGRPVLDEPDDRLQGALPKGAIAYAGDVGLVAHDRGQLEARPGGDLARERLGLLRRTHRRALGADLEATAQRPPAHVQLRANPDWSRRLGHRGLDVVEVLHRVDHHDRRVLRVEPAELRQCAAMDGWVGEQKVVEAVAVKPESFRERERHQAAEARVAGQDRVQQRPAAH